MLEADLAALGIDAFDFGGSVLRKISHLAKRNGFLLPVPHDDLLRLLEHAFDAYCRLTRTDHAYRPFMSVDTTAGESERAVEDAVFGYA